MNGFWKVASCQMLFLSGAPCAAQDALVRVQPSTPVATKPQEALKRADMNWPLVATKENKKG